MRASECKSIRDAVDASPEMMGALLQVTPTTIRRWENPNNPRPRGLAATVYEAVRLATKRCGIDPVRHALATAPAFPVTSLRSILNMAHAPKDVL